MLFHVSNRFRREIARRVVFSAVPLAIERAFETTEKNDRFPWIRRRQWSRRPIANILFAGRRSLWCLFSHRVRLRATGENLRRLHCRHPSTPRPVAIHDIIFYTYFLRERRVQHRSDGTQIAAKTFIKYMLCVYDCDLRCWRARTTHTFSYILASARAPHTSEERLLLSIDSVRANTTEDAVALVPVAEPYRPKHTHTKKKQFDIGNASDRKLGYFICV